MQPPSLARLVAKAKQRRSRSPRLMSDAEAKEWELCSPEHGFDGFARWCAGHVWIEDKQRGGPARFHLFPGQRRVARYLCAGQWVLILKGRQLGVTWVVGAYALWRIIYSTHFLVNVVSQGLDYAEDFVGRVSWIYIRLPWYMQPPLTTDTKKTLAWSTTGFKRELWSRAGGGKGARSTTSDLFIADEASRVDKLAETLGAAQPALEVAGGQSIVLSTSAGPTGDFKDAWDANYGDHGELIDESTGLGPGGYKPVFMHWSERPGRDRAWHKRECAKLAKLDPVLPKQEYPDTIEEAWEHAAGRVYPRFSRAVHVASMAMPARCTRYRCIDWGQTDSPHVCLWVAHLGGPTGLVISPDCPNAIREFIAYRWKDDGSGDPEKKDDHCPDALRYLLVTRPDITGLVYVYRELYIKDVVAHGWTMPQLIEKTHLMSGWERVPNAGPTDWRPRIDGEVYAVTVADRAWALSINDMCASGIATIGHSAPRTVVDARLQRDPMLTEVKEGIRHVTAFVDATHDLRETVGVARGTSTAAAIEGERAAAEERRRNLTRRERLARRAASLRSGTPTQRR